MNHIRKRILYLYREVEHSNSVVYLQMDTKVTLSPEYGRPNLKRSLPPWNNWYKFQLQQNFIKNLILCIKFK